MKKWYDEEYEFEVEVTGYLRGDRPERYCQNGEQIGDKYKSAIFSYFPIIIHKFENSSSNSF
mgnify:CR=1 FL=1